MEDVLYKTFARRETHPARIGALARLYGLDAPAPDRCSFFEIGCGDGGNIIPLAVRNPHSRFLGIDLSEHVIEKARADSKTLGLNNIEFNCADISSYEVSPGSYDYVVCHGVYSWVSSEVQRAILMTSKKALRDNGVALISYNTFPGWRQRGVVRDILRVGAAASGESLTDRARYSAAMEFFERLVLERASSEDAFGAYLKESYERLRQSEPSYVIQEFLGAHNSPVLFRDFMKDAGEFGFQFLSEARVVMMSADDLSSNMRELLASFGDDVVEREQVLDICRNRMFRETILCHSDRALVRGLKVDIFKELYFVANYVPVVAADTDPMQSNIFKERATFREVTTPPGECSKLLRVIASFGTHGASVAAVQDVAREKLSMSEREAFSIVATLWRSGFVDALVAPLGMEAQGAGDRKICPWAALQASRGDKVTSALHDSYDLSPLEREALRLAGEGASLAALETLLLGKGERSEVSRSLESLVTRGFFA